VATGTFSGRHPVALPRNHTRNNVHQSSNCYYGSTT